MAGPGPPNTIDTRAIPGLNTGPGSGIEVALLRRMAPLDGATAAQAAAASTGASAAKSRSTSASVL